MNISPISFKGVNTMYPVVPMSKNTPDDAIVAWGRTDNQDLYPLTAGQVRAQFEAHQSIQNYRCEHCNSENIDDWYENKVKYSREWAD